MNITPSDVLAAGDVLADINDASDSMDVETAVDFLEAITALKARVGETIEMLHVQLVSILESPREINGNRYEVRPSDGKWRPDHMLVHGEVKRRALVDGETGELRDTPDAVEWAITKMHDLYASASTMPKVGALKSIGKEKWDVAEQEPGKKTLKVTPVVEDPRES